MWAFDSVSSNEVLNWAHAVSLTQAALRAHVSHRQDTRYDMWIAQLPVTSESWLAMESGYPLSLPRWTHWDAPTPIALEEMRDNGGNEQAA